MIIYKNIGLDNIRKKKKKKKKEKRINTFGDVCDPCLLYLAKKNIFKLTNKKLECNW
jgi:hypothetical protein